MTITKQPHLKSILGEWPLWALAAYIIASPLVHNAALLNFCLFSILCATIFLAQREKIVFVIRRGKPLILSVALFFTTLIIVTAFSEYITASLEVWQKDLLAAIIILFLASQTVRSDRELKIIAFSLTIGILLRAIQALYGISHTPIEAGTTWWKGYAMTSCLFLPIIAATLQGSRLKHSTWFFVATAFVLCFWLLIDYPNKSRGPLVASLLGVFIVIALTFNWKSLLVYSAALLSIVIAINFLQPSALERYKSILDAKSYTSADGSTAERLAIWQGIREISLNRPLFGYGPNWKTLAITAKQEGHLERWKSSQDPIHQIAARYYNNSPGTVNPHNLYWQLVYETGYIGLAAFLTMIFSLLYSAIFHIRKNKSWQWLYLAICGFIPSYLAFSMANGVWSGLTPLFVLLGCSLAFYRYADVDEVTTV